MTKIYQNGISKRYIVLVFLFLIFGPLYAQKTGKRKIIVVTKPEGVHVFVKGKKKGYTPLLTYESTADSIIDILLSKSNFADEQISLDIRESKTYRIFRQMRPSINFILKSNPSGANILIDEKQYGKTPEYFKKFPRGKYSLKLIYPDYQLLNREFDLLNKKDSTQFYFELKPREARITISGFPLDAKGKIGTKSINHFPVQNLDLDNGSYKLEIRRKGFYTTRKQLSLDEIKDYEFDFNLKPKSSHKAVLLSTIFPGIGQYFSGRKLFGSLFFLVAMSTITENIISYHKFLEGKREYQKSKDLYEKNISLDHMTPLYNDMLHKYNIMENKFTRNRNSLKLLIGIWTLNIIDTYLFFPKVKNSSVQIESSGFTQFVIFKYSF
jgi:hypothetical protein